MLVLTRKQNESIKIGDNVEVTVLSVQGGRVKIGIKAPADVTVRRREVQLPVDPKPQNLDQ